MSNEFTPEPRLQQTAQNLAELAVVFASKVMLIIPPRLNSPGRVTVGDFCIKLDYSEASLQNVEDILENSHNTLKTAAPSQEKMQSLAQGFGSYLGETYRRLNGGEWGVDAQQRPALRTQGGLICFPWDRAYKRIVNGPEDNVVHWYQYLIENGGGSPQRQKAKPPLLASTGATTDKRVAVVDEKAKQPPLLRGSIGSPSSPPIISRPKGFMARLFGQ